MKITLRTATDADKSFCQQVHHEAYLDVVSIQFGEWDEAKADWFFQQRWGSQKYDIIDLDGMPVGCFSRQLNEDCITIDEIEVLPAFQNHGIGTELVRRQQEEAMRRGVSVRLRVLKKNKARLLYERLDFAVTGETNTHMMMEWATCKTLERTE